MLDLNDADSTDQPLIAKHVIMLLLKNDVSKRRQRELPVREKLELVLCQIRHDVL